MSVQNPAPGFELMTFALLNLRECKTPKIQLSEVAHPLANDDILERNYHTFFHRKLSLLSVIYLISVTRFGEFGHKQGPFIED